jgi:DNA-binding CsgD family transcriptional regulator/tetratricopeptide (TPR) repeat protein
LVGRDAEFDRLERFIASDPPSARTLVLTGGPGIGKTALWEAGIESARAQGTIALVARPNEAESRFGFAALGDLLSTIDGAAFASLPTPQRTALEVALLRAEPSDRPPEARAIAAGFLGILRRLASEEPIVVAVDDVQWLDGASADAIRFAQRRLDHEPVTFLLTERTGIEAETDTEIETESEPAWLGAERSERIAVSALTLASTRRLLSERLDFNPRHPLLREIFESTGGNPLYTLELARTLLETDVPLSSDEPLAVPPELGALLLRRLAKLPETARTAALGAALASDPSTELIEALLGPDAEASLGELVAAGVIDLDGSRIHFTHPLLASTVTAAAVPQRRRAMHHELARLVDDPVASAQHLGRATVEPDDEVADLLEAAAANARARGGWDIAAQLFERSRELTPTQDTEARARRTLSAAEHHAHAGDRAGARSLVEEFLGQDPTRAQRADALRLLAEITAEDENFLGAAPIYEEALEFVDDPRFEATVEDGLAYVLACSWDMPAAATHAHRALAVAETCGDERLLARPLAVCAMVDFMCGGGVSWDQLDRSLALEDPDAVMPLQSRPSTVAALLHAYIGDHTEGREGLSAVWRFAADRGQEGDLAGILTWRSWLETRSGDLATADALAEQAEAMARLTGSQSMLAHAIAQHALVRAHQGDEARAREGAAQAIVLGDQVNFLLPHVWAGATIALLELSLGDAEAAWRACEHLVPPVEVIGFGEPILLIFLPDALDGLIALGQLERAEPLIAALEDRGRELDRTWALATSARCRGLLLAAHGDLSGAASALACAMTEHERLDMPFERARTLLAKGVVERRSKQRNRARESLTEAFDEFERIGARLWSARASDELARVSGRRAGGSGELTPTEARVVELAADGMSNKEIAQSLVVSVNTVETHLSHAYSKLGVRSRSQLAGILRSST